MKDRRSTLILGVFIALQVIIAVALFAGAGGKKPDKPVEEIVEVKNQAEESEAAKSEEVENNHQDVQESYTYPTQEPVVVEEIPEVPAPVEELPGPVQ